MPHSRFRQTLLVLTLAWLGVIAFASHLLFSAEIARRERTFEETIQHLSSELKNKLDTNEAVLAGFSAFLRAVERNDTESATRYAASATASYPHIYMLEVARQVPVAQEAEFQSVLRRDWLPNFTLKTFPGASQKATEDLQARKVTWPILFMYPSLPEAQAIYGVRLETVDFLGHSLALAHKNAKPVVSPVFSMYEGGNAYILLQEVDRSEHARSAEPSIFGNTMTALLLIKTESLIPRKSTASAASTLAYSVSMKTASKSENQLFNQTATASGKLDEWLLPRFTRQMDADNAVQPTTMYFEQQLQWSEVLNADVLVIFGLLTFALISVPALTLRHLRALELGAREHERSAYLATHDLLTGLPNRFLFIDRFDQAVQQHKRNGNGFALLLIDLDHFKEINDTHGHEIGDEILLGAAKRMAGEIRACDTVARHGGDEFLILLANTLNVDDARTVGEKLLGAFSMPAETSAGALKLSCSIGIAMYPENGTTLDEIRRAADRAMYQAKKQGRNQVSTSDADPASIQ
jgi:diguanylate cyclase (GGDEF)-like protein